jgi:hypothetical protein
MNDQIKDIATKILGAKKIKKEYKIMLDTALYEDEGYKEVLDEAQSVSERKKTLKERLISGDSNLKSLEAQLKDANDNLKDLQDSMSAALEAYFIETHSLMVDLGDGTNLTIARKFSLGSKQLSLFAQS